MKKIILSLMLTSLIEATNAMLQPVDEKDSQEGSSIGVVNGDEWWKELGPSPFFREGDSDFEHPEPFKIPTRVDVIARIEANNSEYDSVALELVDDKARTLFLEAIRKNDTLRLLDLSAEINEGIAKALAEFVIKNTSLKILNLSGCTFIGNTLSTIFDALKGSKVRTLSLIGCGLNADAGRIIGESLQGNDTLKSLNLKNNQIGDAGAESLGDGLGKNTTLTELILWNNQIGDAGARSLGAGLGKNATLTSLNLGGNQIGDAGAESLGAGLGKNTMLTELILWNNQIGDAGARSLGAGLGKNATLTLLNLNNNQVSGEGAIALGEGLKENTTLKTLGLSVNQINFEGAMELVQLLQPGITLNLSQNKIEPRDKASSIQMGAVAKGIECDLRGNGEESQEVGFNFGGLGISAMPSPYHGDIAQRSDVFVWGNTDRSLGLPKTDATERTDDVAKDSGQQ